MILQRISLAVPSLALLGAGLLFTTPALAQGGPGPGGPPPVGGPFPPVVAPNGNATTGDKIQLGKALFFEEQLSSTGQTSCATCHINSAGGTDPRSADSSTIHPGLDALFGTNDDIVGSMGVNLSLANGTYDAHSEFGLDAQVTGRKAPTMINAAFAPHLFWDGRAEQTFVDPVTANVVLATGAALESQAVGPVVSDSEMGHIGRNWNEALSKLESATPLAAATDLDATLANFIAGRDYTELYNDAFGPGGVTAPRTAMAIAAYERSLISDQAPVNQGPGNLTPLENQGLNLFVTKARCVICHTGPLFTDFDFKNTGVTPIFQDFGRGGVTGNPQENGRFKTPDLLNIELRAPYFHDGSAKTLEEVVDFYDRGGDFHANQAAAIIPLGLTAPEKTALVAFLKRPLTDTRVAAEVGPFSRPTLYSESSNQAVHYGQGTPAAFSGITPRAIAVEPQYLGNSSLTVAVADAPGQGLAILAIDFSPGFFLVEGAGVHLAASPALRVIPVGPVQGSGPGGGYASASLPIPNSASLIGLPVFMQWFIAGANVSASEAISIELF
ncbi:MAG: cytochrome c peroxidase [Bacteroidia bacterium]|jgi:cytochrome c peroxidase